MTFTSANLSTGVVLSTTEDRCTLVCGSGPEEVGYLTLFPGPRVERVLPGHLVAVHTAAGGERLVVWRWYDAVVVGEGGGESVALWEPAHGVVHARPRGVEQRYPLGSRAYASAGLPGADWWVAGPVVAAGADPVVELDELAAFLTAISG